MISTELVGNKLFAKLDQLTEWDRNPRGIKPEDFIRLKVQLLKLDQYKPLTVMNNGTTYGGNMRLRGYKSLVSEFDTDGVGKMVNLYGVDQQQIIDTIERLKRNGVWVSIIEPKDEKQKLEYALSDNDNVGYYVEEKLLALINEVQFTPQELEMLKVDLSASVPLPKLLAKQVEDMQNKEVNVATMTKEFNCQCPKCGFPFNFEFEKNNE